MVGGAIPGLVVLGAYNKQVEQVMRSKLVGSTLSWVLLQFLPLGSYLEFCLVIDYDAEKF